MLGVQQEKKTATPICRACSIICFFSDLNHPFLSLHLGLGQIKFRREFFRSQELQMTYLGQALVLSFLLLGLPLADR